MKDLGVQIDADGTFTTQRMTAIEKAKNKANWVLRTFKSRDKDLMIQLWKSLIRPHIDYCSQLWSPTNQPGPMKELEEPLKAYTKKIKGCWNLNYWERLEKLNITSIQRRHERYRAIYL